MEKVNALWVVEWSESQKSFHIDTLEKTLKRNTSAFIDKRKTDYKPLALASSQSEATKLKALFKQQRVE